MSNRMRSRWSPGPPVYAIVCLILVSIAIVFRQDMTATMTLHMLVHIPLILLAGACAAAIPQGKPGRAAEQLAKYNGYGVPGLLFVTFTLAYWMIPKSLDHVLLSAPADWGKFLGLFIAGMVLHDSLRRADKVIKLFFIGNFSWMTAIAGMLYQDNPARLCNFYLLGDQELAGRGLVIVAVAVPLAWLWAEYTHARRRLPE